MTPENPDKQFQQIEYYEEDEINLVDLLIVLLRRKKLIIGVTFLAIILSVVVSLLLQERFTATARILPPQEKQTGMSSLLNQAGGAFSGLAANLMGGSSSADLYVGIMKSRTVADALIKKYDLMNLWNMEFIKPTYEKLSGMTNINIDSDTGIISVSVEDFDPQLAADMANSYVETLDYANRNLNLTDSQRKRKFLEKRLEKARDDLIKAESELKAFQEKHKIVAINEQAKASIEGAAKLRGEIIAAQTELEVFKSFGTENQNEAIMLKAKIEELEKQLTKIESGPSKQDKDNYYISFKDFPDLGMQYARLMRNFKIEEQVFEMLTSQYELALIEEAKDVNTIQVLDQAVPPDRKSSPNRKLIVMLSTVVAFFLAVFLAFILEFFGRIKADDPERYQMLANSVRFWKRNEESAMKK
jgi:uncharacterized protein involved in exopolysaccharide biosynthesis